VKLPRLNALMQLVFDLDPMPSPGSSTAIGKSQRSLIHRGISLTFTVQRTRRRSIGLTVSDQGLKVTAPSWVSFQQIDQAVLDKFDWVEKKLHAVQARAQRLRETEALWRAGGQIVYLGQRIALECASITQPRARGGVWFEGDEAAPQHGQRLWLPLPPQSSDEQVREAAQGWLQRQARQCFERRLTHFEAQCGLKPSAWRLSSATTRWGACNSDGRITLNWRLIHFPLPTIDYVIAHELAHLKELNHSAAFWQTVQSIYPNYLHAYESLKGLSPGDMPAV
jgi:predicted metal-dependent hydrolase